MISGRTKEQILRAKPDKADMSRNSILPVYMIFVVTGMVDATGPMVGLAKESFHISNAVASLLPMLGFIMFGLVSIPIGLLQDKKSKKHILKMGLFISLVGLVVPICSGMYGKMVINGNSLVQFYEILVAIVFLGAGAAILHVSGNPIMRDLFEDGKFSKNLSMAQFFNTIGSSLGFLLPIIMLYAFGLDWSILFPFFACLVIMSIILLSPVRIIEKKTVRDTHATFRSCLRLLKDRYVLMMVLGVFIYCGTEISMSSFVPVLLKEKYLISIKEAGLIIIWFLFYLPILLGRLIGYLVMSWIPPKHLLLASTIVALTGVVLIFQNSLGGTLLGVFLAGLGFANICPLIFSIVIDRLPEHANELSGLMVSAIAGAAFVPPLMGLVADGTSVQTAFFVPLVCVVFLLIASLVTNMKIQKETPAVLWVKIL